MALRTNGVNRWEFGDVITLTAGTATASEVQSVIGGNDYEYVTVSVRTASGWGGTATVTPYMDADDTVGGEPTLITIADCTLNKADVTLHGCYSVGVSIAGNDKATTVRVAAWRE